MVLNAILMSVFLNRFVIFLTWGVVYVKVVHFVSTISLRPAHTAEQTRIRTLD